MQKLNSFSPTIRHWKPWLTGDVHRLLRARANAFRAGDVSGLRTARTNLSCSIRKVKQDYTHRITSHFRDSRDAQSLWQGIQPITDYKPTPQSCESNISLLNNLNSFFACFEAQNNTCPQKTPPPPHDQTLCLSAASVKRTLSAINIRKATGSDDIPGHVLKDCTEELKDVFTNIFNTFLRQVVVPSCFKAATIIPVSKKSAPSCFNDYRPAALTPIITKCFEQLVMSHIKSILPPTLDPFQFAYRAKRSTEDAICSALHPARAKKDSCENAVHWLQFSFQYHNPTTTHLQTWQIGAQHLPLQLVVRVSKNTSSSITLSTGAPQGCVLSPLLFTMLTHDCTTTHSTSHIVKFVDDTTLVGLITKGSESQYRKEVNLLTMWCRNNNLLLNVSKTTNTASLVKKAQGHLYFLCKLRRASAPPSIMSTFYRGTTESILFIESIPKCQAP